MIVARSRGPRIVDCPLLTSSSAHQNLLIAQDFSRLPRTVDVLVHLHGFGVGTPDFLLDKARRAGLGAFLGEGTGRSRAAPTVALVPLGRAVGADGWRRDFSALVGPPERVSALVEFALGLARGRSPTRGRLLLSAHSGGGAPVLALLRQHDFNPDEVHVFDALYEEASPLLAWALARLQEDASALARARTDSERAAVLEKAAALRVINATAQTLHETERVDNQLRAALGRLPPQDRGALSKRYRCEQTNCAHDDVGFAFGGQLLANAAADLVAPRGKTIGPLSTRRRTMRGDGYTDPVPISGIPSLNAGLRSASEATMIATLGAPRMPLTTACANDRASAAVGSLVQTTAVTPLLRVTGIGPAIESLRAILASVAVEHPDLVPQLRTAGMLCVRLRKPTSGAPSTKVSNHAWGTAVDFELAGGAPPGDTGSAVPRWVALLVPYFNAAGWYSGIGFRDAMHFEVADQTIRRWADAGVLRPRERRRPKGKRDARARTP